MELTPWQPNSESEFVGAAVLLMQHSHLHCRWRVPDFERLLVPPYKFQQFRCYKGEQRMVGLVTWAYLSDECAEALTLGTRKMQGADWRSGNQTWLIDVIAPFGGIWAMVSDLRRIHVGRGFALRRNADGSVKRRVSLFHDPSFGQASILDIPNELKP